MVKRGQAWLGRRAMCTAHHVKAVLLGHGRHACRTVSTGVHARRVPPGALPGSPGAGRVPFYT
eukprot:9301784-Alexandrium_andersonii.AAC.1